MFADDCTLTLCGSSLNQLLSDCNDEIAHFKSWSDSNRLTLNAGKTVAMLISNTNDGLDPNSLMLNDQPIGIVDDTKFLGIFLDKKLKFDTHINYICGKISRCIGILFKIRCLIPLACLRMLYFTIIHPYILYCLPIYGATYDIHIQPLVLLQKKAIRIISGAGILDHSTPLFYKNKILKIGDLYKHSVACYVFKNPGILDRFQQSHSYNTRYRNVLVPPRERLRSTEQSVIYNAVKIWNEVPENIKLSLSLQSFKYKYKEFLLSQYISL